MTSDLIYDVGMNNGDDTAYYLHRGFRVVAIEADPNLVAQCSERFRTAIEQGRLTILNCAIGPTPGTATFYLCREKPEWNSFRREAASRRGYTAVPIEVEVRDFADILIEHGSPHYLKIDIEGHDIYCLQSLHQLALPRYLSFELGEMDELLALRELGYDRFKIVIQGRHRALADDTRTLRGWMGKHLASSHVGKYVAKKAGSLARRTSSAGRKLGQKMGVLRTSDWKFPHGSSGPFGEETPGEWLSFNEACLRWLDYVRMNPGECWCDIHATHASPPTTERYEVREFRIPARLAASRTLA